MSTSAASHLSPAFPERAAWGTAGKLRAWQAGALERYLSTDPRDFLAVATPGAGKTTFALRLARELVDRGTINRITVVCPTEHLKRQWADAAARVGLALDPNFKNADGSHGSAYMGAAVTYAQVAVKASVHRHLVDDAAPILSRANLAIATLERYAHRLDEVLAQLSRAEIEDVVTVREVAHVVQRLELVRRLAVEIEQHVLELGTSGRQIALQLEDLLGESISLREPVLRDYLGDDDTVDAAVVRIDALTDADLLAATTIAAALGFSGTVEAQDEPVSPRGHRLLGSIPRLRATQVEALVGTFGSLQTLLAASAADLQAVPGIGSDGARQAREGLSRLAEASVERF